MRKSDFRKKLIEVRTAKGFTQEEVAERCCINVRTIQRIESGAVVPRAFTVKVISEELDFKYFESPDSKLNNGTEARDLKELFNLKTNTMKKLSILTAIATLIVFLITSGLEAQTSAKNSEKTVTIFKDNTNSVERIEVRFTNRLTLDSLIEIKDRLSNYNVELEYKQIEFDESYHLEKISCEVISEVGGGTFTMPVNTKRGKKASFFCDFTGKADPSFCVGACLR